MNGYAKGAIGRAVRAAPSTAVLPVTYGVGVSVSVGVEVCVAVEVGVGVGGAGTSGTVARFPLVVPRVLEMKQASAPTRTCHHTLTLSTGLIPRPLIGSVSPAWTAMRSR